MKSLESRFYDAWTWVHFLGSAYLVFFFYNVCSLDIWTSSVFAIALGLIWELFDELRKTGVWDYKILDPSGFDWGDIVTDIAGISLAVLTISMR